MNEQTTLFDMSSPIIGDDDTVAGKVRAVCQEMLDRREHIEAALAHCRGTHTFDDIVVMVLANQLKWWCLPNSFMITEIFPCPRKNVLHVFLAGGDLTEILATQDDLIAHAKEMNCATITMSGRPGWKKPLTNQGWEHPTMAIGLEVT